MEDPRKNNFSASEIAISTENVEENLHVHTNNSDRTLWKWRRDKWRSPREVEESKFSVQSLSNSQNFEKKQKELAED